MSIITSMFGSGIEVTSNDDPISFSILEDDNQTGSNSQSENKTNDGVNTTVINAKIDKNSIGEYRKQLTEEMNKINQPVKSNENDYTDLLALMDSV